MTKPETQPHVDSPEEELPRVTPEERIARIRVLGMAARCLRSYFQDNYARAVEQEMEDHKQAVIASGQEHLLEPEVIHNPPTGARGVYGSH